MGLSEEAREEFRKKMEEWKLGDWVVDVEWEMMLGKIKGVVKRRSGRRGKWWVGECRKKRREVDKLLRN